MEFKLIVKKLNGNLSAKEQQIFDEWYASSRRHRVYFKRVEKNYYQEINSIDAEKAWEKLARKIKFELKRTIWRRRYATAVAAAAIIIAVLGGSFLRKKGNSIFSHKHPHNQKIALPGTDKAFLTLESGQQVALKKGDKLDLPQRKVEDGQLTYDKNSKSAESVNIKWNIITVSRGGQFHLKLADGTQVYLNAETKLKYPVHFLREKPREVHLLYGEAYFEVTSAKKNGGMPFKVYTPGKQVVEVWGTRFNLKAYKDEPVMITTLIEGKVTLKDGMNQQKLIPNEQAYYTKGSGAITVKKVNTYDALSWRRGEFSFNDEPLAEIVKVLSRWYDIDIVIKNDQLRNTRFNGVLSKDQVLKNILETINKTTPIHYSVINRKLIIW